MNIVLAATSMARRTVEWLDVHQAEGGHTPPNLIVLVQQLAATAQAAAEAAAVAGVQEHPGAHEEREAREHMGTDGDSDATCDLTSPQQGVHLRSSAAAARSRPEPAPVWRRRQDTQRAAQQAEPQVREEPMPELSPSEAQQQAEAPQAREPAARRECDSRPGSHRVVGRDTTKCRRTRSLGGRAAGGEPRRSRSKEPARDDADEDDGRRQHSRYTSRQSGRRPGADN